MSGAWVVSRDAIYGMILAVVDAEPRVLILPIILMIKDLMRLYPGNKEVNIANGAQDRAEKCKALIEYLKDPNSSVPEVAITDLMKQPTLQDSII
jgi:hypothetical protein